MLVNLNDVLLPAKKAKYAVGLFNAVNLELARGIIRAAEETQSPVIVGTVSLRTAGGSILLPASHGEKSRGTGGRSPGSRT